VFNVILIVNRSDCVVVLNNIPVLSARKEKSRKNLCDDSKAPVIELNSRSPEKEAGIVFIIPRGLHGK
jgi:hypothetical protein